MSLPTTLEYAPAPVPVAPRRLAGSRNIFQKELREWFKTRKFRATAILTTLMLAAVPIILFLHEGGLHDGRTDSGYRGLMEAWLALTLTLGSYLVVSLTMGVLIKEEDAGTAQWLFTKPVSRIGYVLAKYLANCLVVVLAGVVIPGLFYFALIQAIEVGGVRSWTAGFELMGFASLHACIVIAIVIGLSAFFRSTAPVAVEDGLVNGLGRPDQQSIGPLIRDDRHRT